MNFITKKIPATIIGIIDIGTYKVRVGICKFKNKELELIGYSEKRQNLDHFNNTEDLCKNIALAIEKAESDAELKINSVIINLPFEEIFFNFSSISHLRNRNDEIEKTELKSIIKQIEYLSLRKHYKKIKNCYGYCPQDLRVIISSVAEIRADDKKTKKLLGTSPNNIHISLANISIPEQKYELVQSIGKAIEKDIVKIIPSEFALTKLVKNIKNVIIIDIGSCSTSFAVKKEGFVVGIQKLRIGINDLVKSIQRTHKKTQIDIIQSIDSDLYKDEKREFLQIFEDTMIIALQEILESETCPSKVFITGGGANKFVQNYLGNVNLNKHGLKLIKKVSFIQPDELEIDLPITNDISKTNLNIYSMMVAALEFIKTKKDPIEDSLQEAVKELK